MIGVVASLVGAMCWKSAVSQGAGKNTNQNKTKNNKTIQKKNPILCSGTTFYIIVR